MSEEDDAELELVLILIDFEFVGPLITITDDSLRELVTYLGVVVLGQLVEMVVQARELCLFCNCIELQMIFSLSKITLCLR